MSFNILEMFSAAVGGPMIRQLSSSLGEPEDATRSAMHSVGPTVLASLIQKMTQPSGATDLFRMVNDDRVDDGIVGKLSSMLGNRGSFDALTSAGEGFGRTILGDRNNAVADTLASTSGIKPGSAMKLLALGFPILFGIIRKYVTRNNLGAGGLASLLFEQRGALEKAGLDRHITSALGLSSMSGLFDAGPRDTSGPRATYEKARVATREPPARKRWLPWAIAAGLAALAFMMWGTYQTERRESTAATTPTDDLTRAIASTSVYFDSGEVALSEDDRQKILRVAEAARGDGRPVAITGYTDRSGDIDQNKQIAEGRAVAVRDALVAEGVSESRIVMDPPSVVTGDGTDQEARRVDIHVR